MPKKFERGTGPRSFRPAFKRGGFGGRNDGPKTMHQATCSNCGKDCQVPFRPTGDKPVYCRDCFNKHGVDRNEQRGERRDFAPVQTRSLPQVPASNENNLELKRQLENVNVKLERLILAVQAIAQTMAASKKPVKKAATKKK